MMVITKKSEVQPTRITVRSWLNCGRKAYLNKPYYQKRMAEAFDWSSPDAYWCFGKRKSGKSNVLEAIATNCMAHGATILDLYSARDNEALAWCRSPYSVQLWTGNSVDLKFEKQPYPWRHMKEFSLKQAEEAQVNITVPGFYSTRGEMYRSLSRILDLLKDRNEWDSNILLLVRESTRLIQSRLFAKAVRGQLEAQYDFIEVMQESYHNGVGVAVDSLRPLSIDINVREVANHVIVKRAGRLTLPKDLRLFFRYVKPQYIRRMPLKDFVVYSDTDDLMAGDLDLVPWHIVRGENIMKQLGIIPVPSAESPIEPPDEEEEDRPKGRPGRPRKKDDPELVAKARAMFAEGESKAAIARSLRLDRGTVGAMLMGDGEEK